MFLRKIKSLPTQGLSKEFFTELFRGFHDKFKCKTQPLKFSCPKKTLTRWALLQQKKI